MTVLCRAQRRPRCSAVGRIQDLPIKPMSVEQCVAEGLAALNANRPSHLTAEQ